MKTAGQKLYARAIGSIFPLCGVGFVAVCAGFATKSDWLTRVGAAIFLSGFAVWGFANGGGFVWAFKEALKKEGVRVLLKQPVSSAIFVLVMACLIMVGIFSVTFITRVIRR